MSNIFITENLRPLVKGMRVDSSALELLVTGRANSFILNHNIDAVSSLLRFLNSSDNIFVLNGFMGSGKTSVADFFETFINDDVLVFRNSYQEATNLDDILLSLFEDFSKYHRDKKIQLPKVETNIFSEKINLYIKSCNVPMVFIFDSLEINTRKKDTQKDILDFINYLSHFSKIKILIVSRTFQETDLLSPVGSSSYKLVPLSKADVIKYIEMNNISGSNYEIEALYKVTRGHFLLLELSVLIMNQFGLSLNLFSNEYKKSTKNFLEYLTSKLLMKCPEKYVKLLFFLGVIRHGVSKDFILSNDFIDIENLETIIKTRIVAEKYGKYYLKDYFKIQLIKNINFQSRIKVHQRLIDLYNSELPLKPFERKLFLSRQTMRQEIVFHQSKIEELNIDLQKTGKAPVLETQNFNYLSYSRTSGYEEKAKLHKIRQKRYIEELKNNKNKKTGEELSQDDSRLFNAVNQNDDGNNEFINSSKLSEENIENLTNPFEEEFIASENLVPESILDYIEIAQDYEEAYNYASAILYYKKALSYTEDETFAEKEPILYSKLANCYNKIQDVDKAETMYEKVYNLLLLKDVEKANKVLLTTARMYSELFKYEKAKEYYKRILSSQYGVSASMIIRVYLDLADIADNNMDVATTISNIEKAIAESEKMNDLSLLSECYFKYALVFDDSSQFDMATKYYLRCIQLSNDPTINKYISLSYSNLAGISTDNGNISAAKMYYDLSISVDKSQNNNEGLYYSYSKLANLYKKEDSDKVYDTLLKALACAKHLDDVNYAVASYIEIGDYYLKLQNYKQALKAFILAKRLVKPSNVDNLEEKISSRLTKIKSALGEQQFNIVIDEIKKHR